jgi:hypothetical protein
LRLSMLVHGTLRCRGEHGIPIAMALVRVLYVWSTAVISSNASDAFDTESDETEEVAMTASRGTPRSFVPSLKARDTILSA